uniref:Acyl-CoA synthetase short-chain family member 3, mitochondrial n=1 Tax=Macrostomum lignano TaxID=282301 RepID=A0A1I8JH35_9PLAT
MLSAVLTRGSSKLGRLISSASQSRCGLCTYENVASTAMVYESVFRQSVHNPEEFWAEQASKLSWKTKFNKVLDHRDPVRPRWFTGGELNTAYNCLDRHVEDGFGDQVAVIHDSPVTKSVSRITYAQLLDQVARFAGYLAKEGVKRGDRVLIYMPMVPETMVAMLGAARLGAIHSLVFGGFAAKELATRIAHAKPKVIVCGSCGVEPGRTIDYRAILRDALSLVSGGQHCVDRVVLFQRPGGLPLSDSDPGLDADWAEALASSRKHDAVPIEANEPVYLLYTSGTTGSPKGVVRPSAGHAVALNFSMNALYGLDPGDVWWAASDFGWVVGHSYICYAPLLHRNTTIIYEGKPVGTPDASQYFRVIKQHSVRAMFTAPTALRAIHRADSQDASSAPYRPLDSLRHVFVAGEHCDVETLAWARRLFKVPVYDHWWQTETGWPITSVCVGLGDDTMPPAGSAGKPVPGFHILRESDEDELGRIVIKLPLPPGTASTLWENDERFVSTYYEKFPGYYDTADAGYTDHHGHLFVVSRVDDVINVSGHRLSTAAMEEACLENPDLAECAVVPFPDKLKGHIPLGFLVPYDDVTKDKATIVADTVKQVREHIGPVGAFRMAVVVHRLPKTRSGKVARGTLASMAAGLPFKMPVTIEDETVYEPIKKELIDLGLKPSDPTLGNS